MRLEELKEEEYRDFLDHHPLKTFLSTPEIGSLRKQRGFEVCYVGLRDQDQLVAAAMLLSKEKFRGKREFYAIRGPLLDYENKELLRTFTEQIKRYIEEHNGFVLRIDPYLIKQERDINGDIVEGGISHLSAVHSLEDLGYQYNPDSEQVVWAFSLDLKDKTKDQILKEMKPNTRTRVKKTFDNGVVVREIGKEELPKFKYITESTSERRNFMDKSLEYYEMMYDLFHEKEQVKYLLAEINLKDYVSKIEREYQEVEEKLKTLPDTPSNRGKVKDALILKQSLEKKLQDAKEMREKNKEDVLVLSAAMFMTYGDEIIYLCSGSIDEYMFLNGQYANQWYMMCYGIDHGFQKYNFYGIMNDFDPKSPDYGIYEFKKGFNGYVEEVIGTYELPVTKEYQAYHRTKRWKAKLKKLLRR